MTDLNTKRRKRVPSFWWDYSPAGTARVIVECSEINAPIAVFEGPDGYLNSHRAQSLIKDLEEGRRDWRRLS